MTDPPIPGQPPEDSLAASQRIAEQAISETPAAPATPPAEPGTSDSPAFQAPFNINDVPADQRPYVEAYQRQLQGAYTRKTQELASQRAQLALYEQLESPDEQVRDAAVREVLSRTGWTVDDPDPEPEPEPPGHEDPRAVAYEQRIAQLEAADAARRAQDEEYDQQAYLEEFQDRYVNAADGWAKRNGFKGYEKLPEHLQVKIAGYVRGTPPVEEDGWSYPDMDSALVLLDAELGAEKLAYLASKDVDAPNTSAVSAQPGTARGDMRNERKRLDKAMEIAGRHLG